MKTLIRFSLGLVSSLLLAAGFSTLAQSVDPLSQSCNYTQVSPNDMNPSAACAKPCSYSGETSVKASV